MNYIIPIVCELLAVSVGVFFGMAMQRERQRRKRCRNCKHWHESWPGEFGTVLSACTYHMRKIEPDYCCIHHQPKVKPIAP